eukprot:469327-Heterocapsa_arctica.AAC.1
MHRNLEPTNGPCSEQLYEQPLHYMHGWLVGWLAGWVAEWLQTSCPARPCPPAPAAHRPAA